MKTYFFLIFLLVVNNLIYSQIDGTVTDSATNEPLQYVNIWIKNKPLGATTNENGQFIIDQARSGDTLVVSFLGFSNKEVIAEDDINILLKEKINELREVIIIPMKAEREEEITSYKRKRQIKDQLFAGKSYSIQQQDLLNINQNTRKHHLLKKFPLSQ